MARSTRKESDVLDGAHVTIFSSAFGWMAVAWKGVSLTRISFGQPTPQAALSILGASEPHRPPRGPALLIRRLLFYILIPSSEWFSFYFFLFLIYF